MANTPPTTTWQAIFAPQYNTYYFYNPLTEETTWINPLQQEPQPEGSNSAPSEQGIDPFTEEMTPLQQEPQPEDSNSALAQDIDPLLARLDPSFLASPSVPGTSSGTNDLPLFTARFNARTGQFTAASARTPSHLSEHERAKRMSEFYFDVGKWEEDLARRGGRLMGEEDAGGEYEEGTKEKKRKRPSKRDLDRFKEQKRLKKIAKTAWLRT